VINWEIVGAVITHEETLYYSRINSKRSQLQAQVTLTSRKERDPVCIVQEAGWVPGSAWTGVENLSLAGINLRGNR